MEVWKRTSLMIRSYWGMHLAAFERYLETERNYSEHTLTAYRADLAQLELWLVTYSSGNCSLEQPVSISARVLRRWIASMQEEGLAPRSIARKLAAAKSYFRFLRKNGHIQVNPLATIHAPKLPKRLAGYLRESETESLLEDLAFPDSFEGIRDKAMLEMLYGCGLRRSELLGIRPEDLDFTRMTVRVTGKGRKMRIVPLGGAAADALEAYIKAVEREGVTLEDFVFITAKGVNIGERRLYDIVKKYLSLVSQLSKRSPHVLRHTFATHLLNAGADLNAIKELLGHSSLAATQVYTHNSISKLKDIYRKNHPKA